MDEPTTRQFRVTFAWQRPSTISCSNPKVKVYDIFGIHNLYVVFDIYDISDTYDIYGIYVIYMIYIYDIQDRAGQLGHDPRHMFDLDKDQAWLWT